MFGSWGIGPVAMGLNEDEVAFWWGARAIFEPHKVLIHNKPIKKPQWSDLIDLLHDRQGCPQAPDGLQDHRYDPEFRKEHSAFFDFEHWIFDVGLPRLLDEILERNILSDSEKVIRFEDGPYVLEASPRASYGYLYIGVARRKE